jgi:hypothetical protein
MAINIDIGTQLFHSATGATASFTKLVSVTAVPATGSAPSKIAITALDDTANKYRKGRTELPDLEFSFPHNDANMTTVTAIEGDTHYFLIIYEDGSGVYIKGEASVWVDAVGMDSMVTGKLHIIAEEIENKTITEVTALKSA